MLKLSGLYVGKQITYSPRGDREGDSEYGFVTSWKGTTVFCRFLRKDWSKPYEPPTLRTVANSEACHYWDLYEGDYMPHSFINNIIDTLRSDPERYGWVEQEQND